MIGLLVWSFLSIPLSIYPGLSFRVFRDVVVQSCGLALLIAVALRGFKDAHRLVVVFVTSVTFYAVMILERFGFDLDVRFGELFTYDTNDFAQVMVCAIPLGAYLALRARSVFAKAMYGAFVGIFLLILVKSGSRGGFLGLVAVSVVALTSWSAVKWKWRLGALVAGSLFIALFASGMFLERIASIADTSGDYNVTSSTGRIAAWKRGMGYMRDNPILGVGVGAFARAEGTLSEIAIQARQRGHYVKWMAPHNSFVEIGAETGVPGLFLFVGLLVLLLRNGRRLSRPIAGRDPGSALLGGALFASMIGFYVTAFFLSQAFSPLLYFLAGLVAVLMREAHDVTEVEQAMRSRAKRQG